MIQKIRNDEFLKRMGNMTAAEKDEYLKRVGEWLSGKATLLKAKCDNDMALFQNVIQYSALWNDNECQAWTEGISLLTAMIPDPETWLPERIYQAAAKRSIRQMVKVLRTVSGGSRDEIAGQQTKQVAKEGPAVETRDNDKAADRNNDITVLRNNDKENGSQNLKPIPARPKHIDQYIHLLPGKTQEKAAMVRGLLRDLDVARQKMSLLMEADAQSDKLAQWAKTATKLDEKVKAIYSEIDAEWEKLVQSGRVVVDDLGNASVVPDEKSSEAETQDAKRNNDTTESRNNDDKKSAKAKRIEYLKKWLRDSRTKPSPERKKQWQKNCKELLKLGGEITDSIRKAAEVYGVQLDAM